jgi:hypothetical protein
MEIENKLLEILVELDYDKITSKEAQKQILLLFAFINWVSFDFMKLETRPQKYGKYLICRKDGKIHWETWNGSGWAYNHNEIRYWAEIKPPCL